MRHDRAHANHARSGGMTCMCMQSLTLTRPHASTPWRTFADFFFFFFRHFECPTGPPSRAIWRLIGFHARPCAQTLTHVRKLSVKVRPACFHDRSCPTAATTAWRPPWPFGGLRKQVLPRAQLRCACMWSNVWPCMWPRAATAACTPR